MQNPFRQDLARTMYSSIRLQIRRTSVVNAKRGAFWVRGLSIINTGRRPRSLDEQLKKIKDPEAKAETASQSSEQFDGQNPGSGSKPTVPILVFEYGSAV